MIDLRRIVESTLVPHTAFEEASRRIEQCLSYAEGAVEPTCIALIGESRTGKSRVLEECEANHPSTRTKEGVQVPIISVKTPSKPTVKGLAELMLQKIGDPLHLSGTENAKTLRLKTLMQAANTRMVMIDEFQHFYDKGMHRVMHYVADWLKILVEETRVALVVSGLPSCSAVIDQNEQLRGRFMAPVRMPRFDWGVREQQDEFIAILGAFYEELSHHFDLPALDDKATAFRVYCGTGGLIGYVTKLFRQSVWDALDTGNHTITLSQLARAHQRSVWSSQDFHDMADPFSKHFPVEPTVEMLTAARAIGIHVGEPLQPHSSRKKW